MSNDTLTERQKQPYFQFAIKHLQSTVHPDKVDRVSQECAMYTIMDDAINRIAKKIIQSWECDNRERGVPMEEQIEDACEQADDWGCHEFEPDDEFHSAAILAAQRLNIRLNPSCDFNAIRNFQDDNSIQARIRSDIFWDFYNKPNGEWRAFCVLTAVYAAIGNQDSKLIRRDWIRYLAAGFNHKEAFKGKKNKLLTTSQVRTTLDKLEARGFFSRFVMPNKRDVHFTNSQKREELIRQLAMLKAEKIKKARNPSADVQKFKQLVSQYSSTDG